MTLTAQLSESARSGFCLEDHGTHTIVSKVISSLIGVISIVTLIITLVTKSHDPLSAESKHSVETCRHVQLGRAASCATLANSPGEGDYSGTGQEGIFSKTPKRD